MRYLGILLICVFLSSCFQTNLKDYTPGVKEVIDEEAYFYRKKDKDRFFKSISYQYYPAYKEFKYQVEDFLYNHSNIQLDFKIEKVLISGRRQSVEVKWYKTYVDRGGSPINRQGYATLIFDVSVGKPKLVNIKGDNPFTR